MMVRGKRLPWQKTLLRCAGSDWSQHGRRSSHCQSASNSVTMILNLPGSPRADRPLPRALPENQDVLAR